MANKWIIKTRKKANKLSSDIGGHIRMISYCMAGDIRGNSLEVCIDTESLGTIYDVGLNKGGHETYLVNFDCVSGVAVHPNRCHVIKRTE